jgi:hypothetical protein
MELSRILQIKVRKPMKRASMTPELLRLSEASKDKGKYFPFIHIFQLYLQILLNKRSVTI